MSRKKAILLYSLLEALLLLAVCLGFVAEVISMKIFILLLVLISLLSAVALIGIIKKTDPNSY